MKATCDGQPLSMFQPQFEVEKHLEMLNMFAEGSKVDRTRQTHVHNVVSRRAFETVDC